MQGIFIQGRRPKSKKEIKEAVAEGKEVSIEATSMFGNDFGGFASELTEGQTVTFVGPDPFTSRKFYGTIKRVKGNLKVS